MLCSVGFADEKVVTDLPLVFSEDFEDGTDRWELTDDAARTFLTVIPDGRVFRGPWKAGNDGRQRLA